MRAGLMPLEQVNKANNFNHGFIGKVLMLQREIPEFVNIAAAKIAKEAGTKVLLDIGGRDEPLSDELLSLVDILSPNETELDRVTGIKAHNFEEAKKSLLTFLTCPDSGKIKRDLTVVLKMGAEGSVFLRYHKDTNTVEEIYKPAYNLKDFPELKLVDTTGAGDCFTAGFAVKYNEGASFEEALVHGNRAGFLTITKFGAGPAIPTLDEINHHFNKLSL
jgi:ribokinase